MKTKDPCKKKKYQEKMVLYLYDELGHEEKEKLEAHLRDCPGCSREFRQLKQDMQALSGMPAGAPDLDWDASWRAIKRGVRKRRDRAADLFPLRSWVLRPAAAILIFALGIVAGRLLFFSPNPSPQEGTGGQVGAPPNMNAMFQEHFDDVQTAILEYANFRPGEGQDQMLLFEKDRIKDLLSRNRLLKNYIDQHEEEKILKQLLEELEFVLLEMSNLGADNPEYLLFIKDLLKEKELLFKMKYLQMQKTRNTGI